MLLTAAIEFASGAAAISFMFSSTSTILSSSSFKISTYSLRLLAFSSPFSGSSASLAIISSVTVLWRFCHSGMVSSCSDNLPIRKSTIRHCKPMNYYPILLGRWFQHLLSKQGSHPSCEDKLSRPEMVKCFLEVLFIDEGDC